VIEGRLYEDAGRVLMQKQCPRHGRFTELISSDAAFFEKMRRTHYQCASGVENPNCENTSRCPDACGLCDRHLSAPAMLNIDLTNRCNMNCPICFASSNSTGRLCELDLEQVGAMLDAGRGIRPHPASCLQYSGGEPTIHPGFLEALRMARARNYSQVQVASNGIRFAASREFAEAAAEAGLDVVYLQFDGLTDEVYTATRGRPMVETKLKAVENIGAAGMRVALVPTIVRGLNDDQLGDILRFAVDNIDVVTAVSWQPVSITGRIDESKRIAMRFTTADLAGCIQQQTGFLDMHRDWYPFSIAWPFVRVMEAMTGRPQMRVSCHPHCGCATYLVVDKQTGRAVPLPAFIDIEPAMKALDGIAAGIEARRWLRKISVLGAMGSMKKYFHEDRAPEGWDFNSFLEFINQFVEFDRTCRNKRAFIDRLRKRRFGMLFLASMHFQDVYNYETDRSRHCVILYAAADGRLYPFCTWNSGPCHRARVEKAFAAADAARELGCHPR
jgi:uncharacterized radical SAM superfamily Fe-S cluster-containing enzyme